MSGPFAWAKSGAVLAGEDMDGRRFIVERHGEGRKYWGVTYPDGTYTHNALTQGEAKQQAETWRPDPTLVPLVDERQPGLTAELGAGTESAAPDSFTAAAVVSAFIDAASRRDVERTRKGWGYQDAGADQQKALSVLRDLAELRRLVDESIRAQVAEARKNTGSAWYSNAATWSDVGAALGVTKQSAQAKYGRTG